MKVAFKSLRDRGQEWFSSAVMVAWGATFALPGDLLTKPDFSGFHRYGTSDAFWAFTLTTVGMAGLVTLYINGRWPRGPLIRMLRAAFGAVSWAQIAYLFYDAANTNNMPVGTGPAVYALLALFEVLSIYNAAHDARYYNS